MTHDLYRSDPKARFATPPETVPEIQQLKQAQRFVIAPDTARVVAELARHASAASVRESAIAPADITWVEWVDPIQGAIGVLLNSTNPGQPARAGDGVVITNARILSGRKGPVAAPIYWDLAAAGPALSVIPFQMTIGDHSVASQDILNNFNPQDIGDWLVAALSLVAAPRLISIHEPDFTKLNKQRRRLGRPEFLPHREITLALGDEGGRAQLDSIDEETRVGRALHHVRAHYRLIPGKVALVRQHWRGEARFGTTSQLHKVRATIDDRN